MKPIRIELPTEFAVGSVNAYLFKEPDPILIDTGVKSPASREALVAALADHKLKIGDLTQVIITHPHVDHFGQAAAIASCSEAVIKVSELGYRWLVDFPEMWRRRIAYYRSSFMRHIGFQPEAAETMLGYMESVADACDPVPAKRVAAFGLQESLALGGRDWQVIHTPGHASHQTCFYQLETCQLISADMLLARAPTPIVERPDDGDERASSLSMFMESLSLVESLEVDVVYPGHGVPFTDHRRTIQNQRDRIRARKNECFSLIDEGASTAADLVNRMYAYLPVHFRFAGLWMLVGYLDLLKQEGRIVEEEIDEVWYYTAAN